jgi:hypothetical protein
MEMDNADFNGRRLKKKGKGKTGNSPPTTFITTYHNKYRYKSKPNWTIFDHDDGSSSICWRLIRGVWQS